MRWAADGSPEEWRDLRLEHLISRETNGVLEPLRFQVLVHVRQGEGCIPTQQSAESLAPIPRDHWVEHLAPAVGTVHVAGPQCAPFQVAVLVEHEQRVRSEEHT